MENYEKEFIISNSITNVGNDFSAERRKYYEEVWKSTATAGRGNVHVAYQGKAIDQMIYEFMEEQGVPGMTLAIVQAPYIPRVVGYGVTDFEKGKLAAAKTLWPVGPISQGYAAVAVMQL